MLLAQKKYQRTRKGSDLIISNELTAQVEKDLEEYIRYWNKKKFDRQQLSDEVMEIFAKVDTYLHSNEDFNEWKSFRSSLARIGIDIDAYHKSKGR